PQPTLYYSCSLDYSDILSFPTRRSSDLPATGLDVVARRSRACPLGGHAADGHRYNGHGARGRDLRALLGQDRGSRLEGCGPADRSEEHTSELQSRTNLIFQHLLKKKKKN